MADARPNILWICTDSQRWDTLGCYGNPRVRSPHVDALAAEGVLFENAYCCNPLCQPSRANFMTGRYPVTTRLRQNGQNIPADEMLVTRLLANESYVCGLSGKLHLSACDNRIKNCGPEWHKADPKLYPAPVEPRIDDGYAVFHWDHCPNGPEQSSAYKSWLAEHGRTYQAPPREEFARVKHGMPTEFNQATWCANKAIDFMRMYRDQPHPWLFSVNIFDPHFPLDPPDEFLEPYLDRLDELPLPLWQDGELDSKPPYQKSWSEKGGWARGKMSDRDRRLCTAAYWAMCDQIDVQVGRMIATLEETGQRENTLIIFTSDHGEMLGDHGLYIKGPFLYDGAVRVPLIISWPGHIPGGRRLDTMIELGDLAPTLLDAAGQPRYAGMQTKSLWPVLTDAKAAEHRDDAYCEYYNSNPNKPPQFCTMLRTKTHKLIVFHEQEMGELYDLAKDPSETHNRWNDPACATVKMALMKRLCDRMARTADPLPERIGIF